MSEKFDELAKGLAQSVTRRGALKKFGLGLAGMALALLGLANKAYATKSGCVQWSCHDRRLGDQWYRYACAGFKFTYDSNIHCHRLGLVDCSLCAAVGQ